MSELTRRDALKTLGAAAGAAGLAALPATWETATVEASALPRVSAASDPPTATPNPVGSVVTSILVGFHPMGLAVNPTTNRLYVANENAGTVSVIDTTTNAVVGSPINMGDFAPFAVAVNPTIDRIYVGHNNTGANHVSFFDGGPLTVTNIANANPHLGVAANPTTGYFWFTTNTAPGTVGRYVVNTLSSATIGNNPAGVAVNATTDRVYVANKGSDSVSVLDGSAMPSPLVISTISVGSQPYGVAVNPTTNRVYVTHQSGGIVTVIDGATNAVITTIPVGMAPVGLAVNPTTNRVYVANAGSGTVSVIDGATNMVIGTISFGAHYPAYVAVNPATSRAYVTLSNDNAVVVLAI